MPRGRRATSPLPSDDSPQRPAFTPEDRENQVINLAFDLAEKQIREGTASAQVITHFLKLASQKERLEREFLSERTRLANAKVQQIDREKERDEMYKNAIEAMRRYSGQPDDDLLDDY